MLTAGGGRGFGLAQADAGDGGQRPQGHGDPGPRRAVRWHAADVAAPHAPGQGHACESAPLSPVTGLCRQGSARLVLPYTSLSHPAPPC